VFQQKKVIYRPFSAAKKEAFGRAMLMTDWLGLVETISTPSEKAEVLLVTLASLYISCFPTKTVRMRIGDKPWIKPSLIALMNARDRAFGAGNHLKYVRLKEEVIKTHKGPQEKIPLESTKQILTCRR
jgi:hypothetical protein